MWPLAGLIFSEREARATSMHVMLELLRRIPDIGVTASSENTFEF